MKVVLEGESYMALYELSGQTGSQDIDLNIINIPSDFIMVSYWMGIEVVESGTGYQVNCTATDTLGNVSDMFSATGDGSSAGALTGNYVICRDWLGDPPILHVVVLGGSGMLQYSLKVSDISLS